MTLRSTSSTLVSESLLGRALKPARKAAAWRHPWNTTALWLPGRKAWAAFVMAGFVNGRAPMVTTTAAELREGRGTFFGQLVDARSGAAEIEQLARLAIGGAEDSGVAGDTRIDVPLYQNPPVGLRSWRKLGWDGEGRVPQFFADRGAANPPPSAAAQLQSTGTINADSLQPPRNLRLLRACDIILHQPRTALTSTIEVTPSGAVSGTGLVNQTLGFREPSPNDRLRLVTGTYEPLQQGRLNFSGASNVVASDYEEKTWDEILIATVYLLSPPNTPPGSEPDARWQPFVKHEAFWNLFWAQKQVRPAFNADIFRPLVALVGILAGGAGIGSVSWFASSINDATQGALNILQAQSLAGSFWTPTGGGTTSTVPVTTADPALTGLDKAARAELKARRAALAKRDLRLDPRFPHEGRSFNLSLLTT